MTIENINLLYNFYKNIFLTFDWSLVTGVVSLITLLIVSTCIVWFLLKLALTVSLYNRSKKTLEVKPLKTTEQDAYSTQELFGLIHSIGKQRNFLERIFGVDNSFSFEIVSTKDTGIRYLITAEETQADLIKKSLLSYLPGVSVNTIKDDVIALSLQSQVAELSLSRHFAFPLKTHDTLNKLDPIAYLTGSMTKLSLGESIVFQVIASPISTSRNSEIKRISHLIYGQKDLFSNINSHSELGLIGIFGKLLLQIVMLPIGLFVFLATNGREGPWLASGIALNKTRTNNPYQQELETQIKQKLDQPLFHVSLRVMAKAETLHQAKKRQNGFLSSLFSMTNTSYQSLKLILKVRLKIINSFKLWLFTHKLHQPFAKSILSTKEISDLYHFPFTKTTKTEDLVKQYSKELPAPLSLKKTNDLDVVFAHNEYGGSITKIGLTEDERRRHMYILGATGTGKSTMLLSMINSDIQKGKGLAVIDPHGDLIEQVLHLIPENRIKDVVYFNPDDIEYPMGINLLELSTGLSEADALREREYIAESIISLFHKIYTEKYSGPRMEYILRNTIHTAFTIPGATLFTVYKLLINTQFRKSVVKNLTDESLKEFWKFEFAKAGDYQKVKMISPITNKIGRFLFSPTAKRILEQEKSTINFEQIMNEGKILLCNLSKGKLGEDNSKVFGVVVMAKLQLASLRRARMKVEDRKDFYLYVDEFQNFATPAFAQILSEARKYKLGAILAHQTTSQLEDKSLVNVTLANTGTVICFRTANPEDETLILPQFRPHVEQGDIAGLPSYRFFTRLGALNPEEPFSGITMPVKMIENQVRVRGVIESSRSRYANEYIAPEQRLNRQPRSIKKKSRHTKQESEYSVLP